MVGEEPQPDDLAGQVAAVLREAHATADSVLEDARREAQALLDSARTEAEQLVESARRRVIEEEARASELVERLQPAASEVLAACQAFQWKREAQILASRLTTARDELRQGLTRTAEVLTRTLESGQWVQRLERLTAATAEPGPAAEDQ